MVLKVSGEMERFGMAVKEVCTHRVRVSRVSLP